MAASSVEGFDSALKRTVLRRLGELFDVESNFAYYNETGRPNAKASHDGSIRFGLKLLTSMLREPAGDYAVMAACAHEFGHIKQFKTGADTEILAKLPCFCIELHADFLAGYFIRHYKELFSGADLQLIGKVWEGWGRSCSHGSGLQRLEALETGYFFADPIKRRTAGDAVAGGVEYLMKYA